jgi:hypothetical protein
VCPYRDKGGPGAPRTACPRDGTRGPPGASARSEKALDISQQNKSQRQLRETFDPFFAALHEGVKQLDKTVRQHEKQQAAQAQAEGKRGAVDRKLQEKTMVAGGRPVE